MRNTKDLKWLLVGTGDIVRKRVATALRDASGSTIHAVCGGEQRAQTIAREYGADQVYSDLDRALADSEADAVYVATPVYRHRNEAVKAIEAGKHVLIEKPLGLNAADAQPIIDAAEANGVTAACAYYRRCFPRYQALKQAVDTGALGTVTLVRTTYHAWFSPTSDDPKAWRIDPKQSGGGPLSDMGCHMIDLIVGLFGLPVSVFAHTDALVQQDWSVEDSSAIVMQLTNGAHVLASFGWNSKTWVHEFEVVGSEARVRWFPADTGKIVTTIGRDQTETDSPNAENVHQPLIENFVDAVRVNREPICSVAEAAQTNRVLDAIYQSSRTSQAVPLSETVAS